MGRFRCALCSREFKDDGDAPDCPFCNSEDVDEVVAPSKRSRAHSPPPPPPVMLSATPWGSGLGHATSSTGVMMCSSASAPLTMSAPPPPPPKSVTPGLAFRRAAILVDRRDRVAFPTAGAPTPTPTEVDLTLVQTGGADYDGTGTIAVVAGSARVYGDAACGAAAEIDLATRTFSVADLTSGNPLYVLANAPGDVRLRLTLTPKTGWTVNGPVEHAAPGVELALEAESFAPRQRVLTRQRKLCNGRMLGVPGPTGWALRSRIHVRASNPAVASARLVLAQAGNLVTLHTADVAYRVRDAPSQALGAPFANADRHLWVAGAVVGNGFLSLGLELVDGTVLQHGDCLKVVTVAQAAFSAGFEWENERLEPEAYPTWMTAAAAATDPQQRGRREVRDLRRLTGVAPALATRQVPCGEAEGVPSKAVVYQSATVAMMVVAEVNDQLDSYGEFVLGPADACATFTNQVKAVHRMIHALSANGTIVTISPADIMNRDDPTELWRPAGERFVLRIGGVGPGTGTGTPQASLGIPLWMVPRMVAFLDDSASGRAAKDAAETWAETEPQADDMVCGLVGACEYYIQCLLDSAPSDEGDGPKSQIAVMFRSDFCAMYGLLSVAQRASFGRWAAAHASRARGVPGWPTYPDAAAYDAPAPACTVAQWFATITGATVMRDGKDALSPPAPYRRHDTDQLIPYAMGKMGVYGQHVIAEWRAMGVAWGRIGFDRLHEFARRWAERIMLPGDGLDALDNLDDVAELAEAERAPYRPFA